MEIRGMVLSTRVSTFTGSKGESVSVTYVMIVDDTAGVLTVVVRGVFNAPRRAVVHGVCRGFKATSWGVIFKVPDLMLDMSDEFTSRTVGPPGKPN